VAGQKPHYIIRNNQSQELDGPPVKNQLYDTPIQLGSVKSSPQVDPGMHGHTLPTVSDKNINCDAKVSVSSPECPPRNTSISNASYYSTPPYRYSIGSKPPGCDYVDTAGDSLKSRQQPDLKLDQVVPTQPGLIGQEISNADAVYSQVRPQPISESEPNTVLQIQAANGDVYKAARSYRVQEAAYENSCHEMESICADINRMNLKSDLHSLANHPATSEIERIPFQDSINCQTDRFYKIPKSIDEASDVTEMENLNTAERVLNIALAARPKIDNDKVEIESEGDDGVIEGCKKEDRTVGENNLSEENGEVFITAGGDVSKNSLTNIGITENDLLFMSPPPQCHHMTLHHYMNTSPAKSPSCGGSPGIIDNNYLEVPEPKNYFSTVIPPNCHTLPRRGTSKNPCFDEYLSETLKSDAVYKNPNLFDVMTRGEKKRSSSDSSSTVYTTIMGELRESCLIDNYKNRKQQQEVLRKQQQQPLTPSHLNQLYVHFAKKRAAASSSSFSNGVHLPSLTENLAK